MEGARFHARKGAESVRHVLRRTLEVRGVARRLGRTLPPEVWEAAVGRELAARAQPTSLTAGVLHVLVQDHRWRDQLDAARVFILEKLNRQLGGARIRELQFGLAHEGALDRARSRAGFGGEERPAHPVCASTVLGGVVLEGELREALLRAAGAAARRAGRRSAG